MKILFVDDEVSVLEGLQNRLRRYRKEWKMFFLQSGQEALEFLDQTPCDVLVTDMRMPGMDGAELLEKVRDQHPEIIRLVLTGQTEKESMLKTLSIAHQILSKPCDAEKLKLAVEHAVNLQEKINNEQIREILGHIDALPALPKINLELATLVTSDNFNMDDVAHIMHKDPNMCARILQIVNSSFFGLNRNITDVSDAITYIGINTLRCIVLNVELFNHFQNLKKDEVSYLCHLQSHSFLTATLAKQMLSDSDLGKVAYSSAILHDIGKLVLECFVPEIFKQIVSEAEEKEISLYQAEMNILSFSHAEMGAYLLTLWDLPHTIVNAVAFHHQPQLSGESSLGPVGAVHIADYFSHQSTNEEQRAYPFEDLNEEYLEQIGAGDKLAQWEAMAKGTARE